MSIVSFDARSGRVVSPYRWRRFTKVRLYLGLIGSLLGVPSNLISRPAPQDQQVPDVGPSTHIYEEGWKAYAAGDYERTLSLALLGLAADRRTGSTKGMAEALNLIGTVHYKRGDYAGALPFYLEAAQTAQQANYSFGLARDWSSLGSTYFRTGSYQEAKEYYEKSLQLRKELGAVGEVARALNDLANVYQQLGNYAQALSLRHEALHRWERAADQSGIADVLNDIGWTYDEMGSSNQALTYYRRSLAVSQRMHLQDAVFENLENIGLIYDKTGRHRESLANLNAAYAGFKVLGQQDEVARTLNDLGDTYYRLGAYAKALARYREALQIDLAIGNRPVQGVTLASLMKCWRVLQRPSLAIFFGKQAVNLFQQLRKDIYSMDPALQKSFLRKQAGTYRELAALLITQGRLPEAQQVLDLLKNQEYFEFIRRDDNSASSLTAPVNLTNSEASLNREYQQSAGRVTAVGNEWAALRAKPSRTPEEQHHFAELSEQLKVANQAWEDFLTGLYAELGKSPEAQKTVQSVQENASGMQRIVRQLSSQSGTGVVALYTLVGEEKYRIIVVTPTVMVAREYPIRAEELRTKVFDFRRALLNPRSNPVAKAQELYRILVGPVAQDLAGAKAETLMWSLDDVLRYLPMAALHDGQQYLLEKHRNEVFTPASMASLTERPDVTAWRGLAMGVSKSYGDFVALPAVPEELRGIIRATEVPGVSGVLPGRTMLDETFTVANLKEALEQNYPLVHIASHFDFEAGNETSSFLLLGGKDAHGERLTLAEIRQDPAFNFADTELLTLSACNTAVGGAARDGREVDGLAMLAQQKGARAVVASLWGVYDPSTGLLMQEFYKLWTTHPDLTKAEALRQAQLELLHGTFPLAHEGASTDHTKLSPYAHPFYWAPFILIGNWR